MTFEQQRCGSHQGYWYLRSAAYNEEDWPLRSARCFGEPPPSKPGKTPPIALLNV